MRKFSVVILSNEPAKVERCVASIREFEPDLPSERVFVMAGPNAAGLVHRANLPCRVVLQESARFNFSREVNRGIRYAWGMPGGGDVFLLGDDARLVAPGTISRLAEIAESLEGRCILSPAISGRIALGNSDGDRAWASSFVQGEWERFVQMVPFFATYLPGETIREVGPLDERFDCYGSDDDDYCYRARLKGIPVIVESEFVVFHEPEDRAKHRARWGADRFKPGGEIDHGKLVEKHGSYPLPTIPYVKGRSEAVRRVKSPPKRSYEVFTVSGHPGNYRRLLNSLKNHEPEALSSGRVLVLAGWPEAEVGNEGFRYLAQTPGPFSITRENNRALREIWGRGHDAILVEDDVELVEPTFDALAHYAEAYSGRALVQPAIEGYRYGNIVLSPDTRYLARVEPKHFPIICSYFPVELEMLVGYYDEGFATYGGDDNDYSLRCGSAGVLQVALSSLSVRHHFSDSVYGKKGTQNLDRSKAFFLKKWGRSP